MNNKLPLRTRTAAKEDKLKTSDILSFSSALVVVVSSAILYLAGWVYLAHWYAYFGMDATQINLPTQTVIIHGLPSILILVLAGLSSASIVAVWKIVKSAARLEKNDFPIIVVIAYLIAFLFMGITSAIYGIFTKNIIPTEVIFALVLSFLLAVLIWQLNIVTSYMLGETNLSLPGSFLSIPIPRAYAVNRVVTKYSRERKYSQALKLSASFFVEIFDLFRYLSFGMFELKNLDFFDFIKTDNATESEIKIAEENFIQLMKSQKNQLTVAFTKTWQFWVGAVLILYLLVSISTSAIFGEWDAARSKRLLVGDWQIPEISLYSDSAIPALQEFKTQSIPGYEYKSLGLLASDNNVYYLVELKKAEYYQQKPKVYIVPRNDKLMLNFIVSYYNYPTPTPKPLPSQTNIPTIVPTVSVSATPTP
jgi:hypothetical protein